MEPRKSALLPLAAAVLAACCLPHAAAHGMLEAPVARNILSKQAGLQFDPQSFSAGGEHRGWCTEGVEGVKGGKQVAVLLKWC